MTEEYKGNISDGYHTFDELYEHRHKLFCLLLNTLDYNSDAETFKTKKNDEGEEWDGWFIAGFKSHKGQITYHLPIKYWNCLIAKEQEKNINYDGHSSDDVLDRLQFFIEKLKEEN